MVCGQSDIDLQGLTLPCRTLLLADNSITFVDTPGNNTSDDYSNGDLERISRLTNRHLLFESDSINRNLI